MGTPPWPLYHQAAIETLVMLGDDWRMVVVRDAYQFGDGAALFLTPLVRAPDPSYPSSASLLYAQILGPMSGLALRTPC